MRKLITICAVLGVVLTASSMAAETGFYAITNELGYQGTIWNETDSTGPWTTSTPRDGYLYIMVDFPDWTNHNQLMSNYWQHPESYQDDSYLQISDDAPYLSVTSASGTWDSTLKVFTVDVTGANAGPYPNGDYPWFWQPDTGLAYPVKITDYAYSFTAIFAAEAAIDTDGWLSNTVAPESITGSFTGHFVSITSGDTYGFDIGFSKAMFDSDDGAITPENYWSQVPEPATMCLFGLGALSLLKRRRA